MAASATAHAGEVNQAPVAHHFDNLLQQQATVRFGMWLFLITEVLFFAGVICAYTVYRIWYPREFEAGSAALNVGIASVNTFLLLASSLTITLGIRACYEGSAGRLRLWILATMVLGTAFLGLKMREYYLDYEEGLIPSQAKFVEWVPDGNGQFVPVHRSVFGEAVKKALEKEHVKTDNVNFDRVQLFFMFYYVMTGLHVLHMVVGLGLLLWQYILASTGFFNYPQRYIYIEVMSLYWHFVDIVWIFLVPLLYLAGHHTFEQAVEGFKQALGMTH
ncbi:cytochrome c oxidase subunit 3 [Fimbriiglobus ruber]|uniref:Cytochrome c oxidase polypeptide III n=1 Tax=Fimbriiglobus ruber TaxID=1908690 RepID=A0A225D3X7_9BACT|nr:cytochrome c oxidase subunit 3 [Fimbriiglobus ruber]OWK36202.1 Cytochrome c oxidase polypeptide III [Fimbriiglobus ruber]